MARGKKAKGDATGQRTQPSVAAHPRAKRSISRVKAWCGLLAFAVVAFFSYRTGVPAFEIGARALAAGVAAYLIGWALAVGLWQRLVVHELKVEADRRRAALEARQEQLRAREAAEAAAEDEEVVA